MLVATQQQQLLDEAKEWISNLISYIANINELKNQLYKWVPGKSEHDVLVQIERYHNQFHIQLINLHDIKHSIRLHIKELQLNPDANHTAKHGHLEEQYDFTIKDL